MTTFSPSKYALDCGWDFSCIEATAERGLADTDVEAIDQWAGVHGDDYDPPTDEAAEEESRAVEASQAAREVLLAWCKERVAEAKADEPKKGTYHVSMDNGVGGEETIEAATLADAVQLAKEWAEGAEWPHGKRNEHTVTVTNAADEDESETFTI